MATPNHPLIQLDSIIVGNSNSGKIEIPRLEDNAELLLMTPPQDDEGKCGIYKQQQCEQCS
jgi:hypothetical protein